MLRRRMRLIDACMRSTRFSSRAWATTAPHTHTHMQEEHINKAQNASNGGIELNTERTAILVKCSL
jgi:hypothetical protein